MVESDLEFLIFVVAFDLDNQASTVVQLCLHGSEWSVGVRSLVVQASVHRDLTVYFSNEKASSFQKHLYLNSAGSTCVEEEYANT